MKKKNHTGNTHQKNVKFIAGKGGNRKKYGRIFILIYIAP
jgi:hypothetical protein